MEITSSIALSTGCSAKLMHMMFYFSHQCALGVQAQKFGMEVNLEPYELLSDNGHSCSLKIACWKHVHITSTPKSYRVGTSRIPRSDRGQERGQVTVLASAHTYWFEASCKRIRAMTQGCDSAADCNLLCSAISWR